MTTEAILEELRLAGDPERLLGMSRFGIRVDHAYGLSTPFIRSYAKRLTRNHALALELWESGVHEARILASLVANPTEMTEEQMEHWASEFDSWDVCDQCCGNLFDRTSFAFAKALEWSARKDEFVKRAGFVLMATTAVHQKKAGNEAFIPFFDLIEREAWDERNFVKKAVNWALRQLGKRNRVLHQAATEAAKRIGQQPSRSAKWIAADALRELTNERILERIKVE